MRTLLDRWANIIVHQEERRQSSHSHLRLRETLSLDRERTVRSLERDLSFLPPREPLRSRLRLLLLLRPISKADPTVSRTVATAQKFEDFKDKEGSRVYKRYCARCGSTWLCWQKNSSTQDPGQEPACTFSTFLGIPSPPSVRHGRSTPTTPLAWLFWEY